MKNMRFKVGDRVRIKSLDWYNENKDADGNIRYKHNTAYPIFFTKYMSRFCDEILTIKSVFNHSYYMNETGSCEFWTDEMIEGLVEEEFEVDLIPKFGEYSDNEPLDVPTMTTEFVKEHGLPCPEGFNFKDENGNVINAKKIVLEKKENEYPNSYSKCCDILGCPFLYSMNIHRHAKELQSLYMLLICRDAYWKIAGEEMGLGKPWEPDWENPDHDSYPTITRCGGKIIRTTIYTHDCPFAFPTAEMRDAFYENFKELIENCKEFL